MNHIQCFPFDLDAMSNVDIRTVDPKSLVDLQDVVIKKYLPKDKRMLDFVGQIHNPYCYTVGKIIVKVGFSDTTVTLDERMESYLRTL